MPALSRRAYGIALVALSAVLWSTAGVFVRLADVDAFTIVTWRSVFSLLTLGGLVLLRQRLRPGAQPERFGRPGLVAVGVAVVSAISYVGALRLTSVATVMTVYAALPFIATAVAFVVLRERVTRRFLVAGSIAFAGIALTAGTSTTAHDLLGLGAALAMTTGFALQLVIAKRHPSLDVLALGAMAAAACIPITAPFAQAALPTSIQLLGCALYGVLTTGFAYVLALEGGRHVTSGEAGFISMLDVVLAPFWVWLFFAEEPQPPVLLGGLAVLGAVAWYLAPTLYEPAAPRDERPADSAPASPVRPGFRDSPGKPI